MAGISLLRERYRHETRDGHDTERRWIGVRLALTLDPIHDDEEITGLCRDGLDQGMLMPRMVELCAERLALTPDEVREDQKGRHEIDALRERLEAFEQEWQRDPANYVAGRRVVHLSMRASRLLLEAGDAERAEVAVTRANEVLARLLEADPENPDVMQPTQNIAARRFEIAAAYLDR